MMEIATLINKLLWDFPPEKRIISKYAIPVLKRRIKTVPLPEQIALNQTLNLTK